MYFPWLISTKGSLDLGVRVSLTNAYRHLFYPANDPVKAPKGLMHYTLPAQDSSDVKGKNNQQDVILKALKDCQKIRADDAPSYAPAYILQKVWLSGLNHWTTKALKEAFAKDLSLNIFVDAEISKLRDTIRQGLQTGNWDMKVGEKLFIKTDNGKFTLPDSIEFSERMELYRRGILEPPKPREIELNAQVLSSTESVKPVRIRWKASGALTIKLYQDGNLVTGEFRPSDEYETAIAKTTTFKIVADYGNGEVEERETQAKILAYGAGTPSTPSAGEDGNGSWNDLSLFKAKPEEFDLEGTLDRVFNELGDRIQDNQVQGIQSLEISVGQGAWDVLAKSLIDAGFEITASWAVSTENPQNLHQAQKNAVSSTVLLVCRKRDPNAEQAWWDDVRIDVRNIVFKEAPELEKCLTADSRSAPDKVANPYPAVNKEEAKDNTRRIKPPGINLCLSAFGCALSVFTKYSSVLDSAGNQVEPKAAFEEVRQAVVEYRLQNLLKGKDFNGIDPLTQWYILAWDTFEAREFPFDEARQLALAVGGFDVSDLVKKHKLLDSGSGYCKLLTPQQRLKKRAFSVTDTEFSARYLVDGLHAIIAFYQEEDNTEPVRRFPKNTGLVSNDLFMRTFEVALKVIPRIGDEKKRLTEEKALLDLWLAMDEIKAKVSYVQPELSLNYGQMSLNLETDD